MNACVGTPIRRALPPESSVDVGDVEPESGEAVHAFAGRHLVATYFQCDVAALTDHRGLLRALESAVKASGATLLGLAQHAFEGGGLTAVLLLSESHASIHTYPEYSACFVDLFTCGDRCRAENFDAVLRDYLSPGEANTKVLLRSRDVVDGALEDER